MTKTLLKPLALAVSAALALTACGKQEPVDTAAAPGSTASAANASSSADATAAAPSVFDISELGPAAEACTDFNQFVNAKWVAANAIPADQTVWGSFNLLREKSLSDQHVLVDAADKNADSAAPGSIEQKIGWLYRSSMNVDARNKAVASSARSTNILPNSCRPAQPSSLRVRFSASKACATPKSSFRAHQRKIRWCRVTAATNSRSQRISPLASERCSPTQATGQDCHRPSLIG